jgi:hypothetical protein
LETEIKINGITLLEYVSGKDGKSGNVPRIRFYKRMSLIEAQQLKGEKISFSRFAVQHYVELAALVILYAIILVGLEFFVKIPIPK